MDRIYDILAAAAEDTRLRILALAAREDLTVSDYVHVLGQSQPRVSRHLKLLVEGGPAGAVPRGPVHAVPAGDRRRRCRAGARIRAPARSPSIRGWRPTGRGSMRCSSGGRRRRLRFFRDNAQRWDELRALHVADREIERVAGPSSAGRRPPAARHRHRAPAGCSRCWRPRSSARSASTSRARCWRWPAPTSPAPASTMPRSARATCMPCPSRPTSFDVVTIHHVLHYAEDPAAALAEAARVVRPGGVVLVVDFSPHDLVELKREHAHVHLGFADNQVQGWLRSAGLNPLEPIHFPGRRLMTGIWRGEREARAAAPSADQRTDPRPRSRASEHRPTSRPRHAAPEGVVRVLAAQDRGGRAHAVGDDRAARRRCVRPSSR